MTKTYATPTPAQAEVFARLAVEYAQNKGRLLPETETAVSEAVGTPFWEIEDRTASGFIVLGVFRNEYRIELPPQFQPLTKHQAMLAQHGAILYHRTERNSDGTALRARTNGRCKVWVTRLDEFRLPMKHGLYSTFAITEHNAAQWSLVEPVYPKKSAKVKATA